MKNKINLDEILDKQSFKDNFDGEINRSVYLNATKEACRQILKLAAENAKCFEKSSSHFPYHSYGYEVNKNSILDTINQID